MKQIYQSQKQSFRYNLKYLLIKSILNYCFYGLWLAFFLLLKFATSGNFYLSGPISHSLVILAVIFLPLITTIMQLKYRLNGSVTLRMTIWLISIYYIFLVAITFLYSILIT